MRCSSYCISESIRLNAIKSLFPVEKTQESSILKDYQILQDHEGFQNIFIFGYGCIVFWGGSQEEEEQFIKSIEDSTHNMSKNFVCDAFSYYIKVGQKPHMFNDNIILGEDNLTHKLAFSYGLSQSVKLSFFEELVDLTVSKTKNIPKQLAEKGRISLPRNEISKQMGHIFIVRNLINLHSKILDTPDYFWENPNLEPLYESTLKDLDIKKRVDLLNRRLEMIQELYSILGGESQHRHSAFLEWIIILLIALEIALLLLKDILNLF